MIEISAKCPFWQNHEAQKSVLHVCYLSKIYEKCFWEVERYFCTNRSHINYIRTMVCHFQVPHVEVKMQFQSTCKTCMFFQKNTFFSFFQNDTKKQFQNCSIQKKMIKIERTHLSLKCFSKKSKLTSQFVVKVLRFLKISHFAPKTAKIAQNTK